MPLIFFSQDVEFKEHNRELTQVDKVKIVACDAKSAFVEKSRSDAAAAQAAKQAAEAAAAAQKAAEEQQKADEEEVDRP